MAEHVDEPWRFQLFSSCGDTSDFSRSTVFEAVNKTAGASGCVAAEEDADGRGPPPYVPVAHRSSGNEADGDRGHVPRGKKVSKAGGAKMHTNEGLTTLDILHKS